MMGDHNGIIRTAKDAVLCKSSSSFLRNDDDSVCLPNGADGILSVETVEKKRLQNPLLNRMYHTRYQIVHKTLSRCLNVLRPLHSDKRIKVKQNQILLLGAGIDISFEELYSKSAHIFAVDFPEIIMARNMVLSASQAVDSHGPEHSRRSRSISIAGDLRLFDDIWAQLLVDGFDSSCPTVVLIECVLCYIDTTAVQQLLIKLSEVLCKESFLILYDPMLPSSSSSSSTSPFVSSARSTTMSPTTSSSLSDGTSSNNNKFRQMMADKFESRKAPIQHTIESKKSQSNFMESCKWNFRKIFNMFEAQHYFLTAEERSVSILLEPFDEFASLALLHGLYSITVAGLDSDLFDTFLLQSYQGNKNVNTIISVPNTIISVSNNRDSRCCSQCDNNRNLSSCIKCQTDGRTQINLSECLIGPPAVGDEITAANILQSHSPIFDENSSNALLQRTFFAESRLNSLIKRKSCSVREARGGVHVSISEGCNSDSAAVSELIKESFEVLAKKFVAVRKFVKNSVKNVANIEKYYSKSEGSNFWIVKISKENFGEINPCDAEVIIGCVGFKRTKPFFLESSKKLIPNPADLENLRTREISEVDGGNNILSDARAGVKDRGEVSHLCIDSRYRRIGIGKILMEFLIDWVKECPADIALERSSCDDSSKVSECNMLKMRNIDGKNGRESVFVDCGEEAKGSSSRHLTLECNQERKSCPLDSIDLTVLTELVPAMELYTKLGFKVQGPAVDLGGDCCLQHMSMRL